MIKRSCYKCSSKLHPGSGVEFDAKHNVLCSHCGTVVFAAEESKERVEKKPETKNPIVARSYGRPGCLQHYDMDPDEFP